MTTTASETDRLMMQAEDEEGVDDMRWIPWVVAPDSGFEVWDHTSGKIGFIQVDRKQFLVTKCFHFSYPGIERQLVQRLLRDGMTEANARAAVDDARTFEPTTKNPTDLASIPRFMRWFESSYGVHTLAAVIHDALIQEQPNSGPLKSDTLSDRFFREMMRSAGVPWLKLWIMWAAVALRSRWAAGGVRRWSVVVWLCLASAGLTSFVLAAGSAFFGWKDPADPLPFFAIALVLPIPAAALWGRQFHAGLIGAAVAIWVLPAAVFASVGYVTYLALESIARRVGLTH